MIFYKNIFLIKNTLKTQRSSPLKKQKNYQLNKIQRTQVNISN